MTGPRTEPLTPSEVIEYRRWVDRGDGLSPFEARRLLATLDAARAESAAGPRHEELRVALFAASVARGRIDAMLQGRTERIVIERLAEDLAAICAALAGSDE
jgi:hypothetical protein